MKKTLLLSLVLLLSATKTFACSCIETNESISKKITKEFDQSDLIITGKVIDIKIVNKEKQKSSFDPIIYKFEVLKNIKGALKTKVIDIVSVESGASCGYKFELGKSYLVYSKKSVYYSSKTKNEYDFATGLCKRNQKLKNVSKKEFRKLEKLSAKKKK